jgi:hypothetical protein
VTKFVLIHEENVARAQKFFSQCISCCKLNNNDNRNNFPLTIVWLDLERLRQHP